MTNPGKDAIEQIKSAYRLMAEKAKYRPAAPSDGMGNITVPEHELNLKKEEIEYVEKWWTEEDKHSFWIGCPDFRNRRAMVFVIEACRIMCGGVGDERRILTLLNLAVEEIKNVEKSQK